MPPTHEVTNQVPPLIDYDAAEYAPILEALHREGASDALEGVHRVGIRAGSAQAQEWGDLAEEHPPVLRTHDRYGNRIDEVRYDPAYHQLMSTAVELGLHGNWDCTALRGLTRIHTHTSSAPRRWPCGVKPTPVTAVPSP